MDLTGLSRLPDHARIWIYGFRCALTDADASLVRARFDEFVGRWHAHRQPVAGAYQLLYDRFVLLAAADAGAVSGCSIDSSIAVLKQLRDHHALDALDQSLVYYRHDTDIAAVSRSSFQQLVDDGLVTGETTVFDNTVTTLGAVRSGRWETTFAASWHARAFAPAMATP